jgi:hypothetical protein
MPSFANCLLRMSKLNNKIIPLTYERYLMLTQKKQTHSEDKGTQCNEYKDKCTDVKEEDILSVIQYKQRGKRLLKHMAENDMKWDLCGRLILGDETIGDTHVTQLIKDVTSDDDDSIPCKASRDFFKLLTLSKFEFKYGESDQ